MSTIVSEKSLNRMMKPVLRKRGKVTLPYQEFNHTGTPKFEVYNIWDSDCMALMDVIATIYFENMYGGMSIKEATEFIHKNPKMHVTENYIGSMVSDSTAWSDFILPYSTIKDTCPNRFLRKNIVSIRSLIDKVASCRFTLLYPVVFMKNGELEKYYYSTRKFNGGIPQSFFSIKSRDETNNIDTLSFDSHLGLCFLLNVQSMYFDIMPPVLYGLSEYAQFLYRHIRWNYRVTQFDQSELSKKLNLGKISNDRKLKIIDSAFSELKAAKCLKKIATLKCKRSGVTYYSFSKVIKNLNEIISN